MLEVTTKTLVVIGSILLWWAAKTNAYHVAIVEAQATYFTNYSIPEITIRNSKNYINIINKITKNSRPLDIIVFPEDTLVPLLPRGDILNKNLTPYLASYVPSASENVIPCDGNATIYAEFFRNISCAAKTYKTYIVINIKEIEDVTSKSATNDYNIYNTDVVFDRSGMVIARYRKFNRFMEEVNVTAKPDIITFQTDFGKTFGIFTCFDVLLYYPTEALLKLGITNFVIPSMWRSELPFLTALQAYQQIAQAANVTFLIANAVNPSLGEGGSAIYLGAQGSLFEHIPSVLETNFFYTEIRDHQSAIIPKSADANDTNAAMMDSFHLYQENLSAYGNAMLDTSVLKNTQTVCQQNNSKYICCSFDYELEIKSTSKQRNSYVYRLFSRLGSTDLAGNGDIGIEVCAIVACSDETINSCGVRFCDYNTVDWPITFKHLKISGNFTDTETTQQYPNSLLADISPIAPAYTEWKFRRFQHRSIKEVHFSLKVPIKKILAFGIYGRNFALDV